MPEGAAPGEGSRSRLPGPAEVPLTCGPRSAIDKALGDYHMPLDPLLQPLRGPVDGLAWRRPRTETTSPFSGTDREPQELTLVRKRNITAALSPPPDTALGFQENNFKGQSQVVLLGPK